MSLTPHRCSQPVCAHRIPGECPGADCAIAHVEDLEWDFDNMVSLWTKANARTAQLVAKKELQETEGFSPDFRFWAGVGLLAFGGYTLWKSKRKSR